MSAVEQELWNIFTFYTLHGNPLDPEHLRSTQFLKLAKDCQIIGTTSVTEADTYVAYTAEVKRKQRVGIKRMNYNDFLTALMKLSTKVYPECRTIDDAFQRVLMENILPLASRRCPDSVDLYLEDTEVSKLFLYYEDAIKQIFQFYASQAEIRTKGEGSPRKGGLGSTNTMKEALGYGEMLKFASDFGLSSSVILSTLEIGDIYLSSIKPTAGSELGVRKLTFREFRESLVRCAIVAYSKISDASIIDKIRGLFLYMWRSINTSVPRAFDARRSVSTYQGDLLSGAMLFNKKFTAQWAADGYRDYLSSGAELVETGREVLSRILLRDDDSAGTPGGYGGDAGAGVASARREPSDSWSAPKSRGGGGGSAGAGAGAGGYEDASPVGRFRG